MIIKSLLDQDTYKLTMAQFVLHQFSGAEVEYQFKCRTPGINLAKYRDEINDEIDSLCCLRFKENELEYLSKIKYFKPDFIEFLRLFKLNRKFVTVKRNRNELKITIKGPWLYTILFEVPILAIVHEVYSLKRHTGEFDYCQYISPKQQEKGLKILEDKIRNINLFNNYEGFPKFKFADFGTRRRFTHEWHDMVIKTLKHSSSFISTSNMYFAMEYNIKPMGTMAHEVFQAAQGLGPRIAHSQAFILQKWADEYRGDLGIALTDTLGINKFLRDFDMYFSKLFDGVRHDSGDPITWGEKVINHYESMGIDPKTKTAVFSDGLDVTKAIRILKHFGDRIKIVFGIGTNLTNDLGYKALQIVIKMVSCNGHPVAKISDDPGKTMCKDKKYLRYLQYVIDESRREQ